LLAPGAGLALLSAIVIFAIQAPHMLAAAGAFALAAWLIGASAVDFRERWKARAVGVQNFASVLAHAGLGISLLGIAGTTLWRSEALEVLAPGQSMQVAAYQLRFDGVAPREGPNYFADRATLDVMRNGKAIATISPEKRSYPAEGQAITDTSIRTNGFSDLYVALGDDRGGGRWTVRAYFNPLAPFIWFGGAIMALGGLASLWGRLRPNALRTAAE
jgi:cytochrome c-type biogenesis protein CcmF